jgi:hypothetical protein
MITQEKIKIFRRYEGDIDGWARSGSDRERMLMSENDWHSLNELLQDLILVKRGLTSSEFVNALNHKLTTSCDSDKTIDELKKLADKDKFLN